VNPPSLTDAALVLLGHGTAQNDASAAPVFQHAAELRRRRIFAEVREAFWKQPPQVKEVLAGLRAPRVFIVPLFISEGFFSSEVIPRELGFDEHRIRNTEHARLVYCAPIGTHEAMTDIIVARAREVVERFPFPRAPKPQDLTLFLAGHGTERNDRSRQAIERPTELLRARSPYAAVHAVFLEESPRIAEVYALAQTRHLVIVPFFMSDGLHVAEDIPVLLGEPERMVKERLAAGQPTWRNPTERHGRLVWYAAAVGTAPAIAEVILQRVQEAAARG
jgi:sirohydrochlorin cobaltochelatase